MKIEWNFDNGVKWKKWKWIWCYNNQSHPFKQSNPFKEFPKCHNWKIKSPVFFSNLECVNESHYKPERILVSNENIFKQRKKTLYSANQSELKSRDSCINQLLCITDDIYQSFYDFLETGIFRNIRPNASPFLRPVIGRWAKDWETK